MAEGNVNIDYKVLLIGGSAGSLEVVLQLLPELKYDLPLAVILVLHRKNAESILVELLSDKTSWTVKEAEEKELIEKGTIYIAPADYHLMIEKDGTFSLDYSEKIHYSRPAIDVTFETAAETFGTTVIALLLSGANSDGAEGVRKVKEAGGITIVQEPDTASVAYMPLQAINLSKIDYVVSPHEMATVINNLGGDN